MGLGRQLAATALLGLVASGCAARDVTGTGSALVVLPAGRRVQYVSSDVRSLKVTITRQADGQTYVKSYPGTALAPIAAGSRFTFSADNLTPGTYVARLDAFGDAGQTMSLGSVTSAPFGVVPQVVTPVTLPSLVLPPTPVGDWRLTLTVALSGGYTITDYATRLESPAGTVATGPAGTSLADTSSFTWGNAPAVPAGLSTTSVTVNAMRKNGQRATKTFTATASIVAGSTATSSLAIAFP